MNKKLQILTNGLLKENPSLRLVLGTCPTLAITTMASNGLGMGLAATFVLIGSNVAVSALRKVIPDKVRLPAFITIIASFVTVLMMAVTAFLPDLDQALGVYLPLIVVNCIILGLDTMAIFSSPPGGFFVFGILMAAAIFIEAKTGHKKERSVGCAGCAGCPSAQQCENAQEGGT